MHARFRQPEAVGGYRGVSSHERSPESHSRQLTEVHVWRQAAVADRRSNDQDLGQRRQELTLLVFVDVAAVIPRRPHAQNTCILGFFHRGFDVSLGVSYRPDRAYDHPGTIPDGISDGPGKRSSQSHRFLTLEFRLSTNTQVHDLDVSADADRPDPIIWHGGDQGDRAAESQRGLRETAQVQREVPLLSRYGFPQSGLTHETNDLDARDGGSVWTRNCLDALTHAPHHRPSGIDRDLAAP